MPNSRPTVTFTMETPRDHRRSVRRRRLAHVAYAAGIIAATIVPSPLCLASGATSAAAEVSIQAIVRF